MINTDKADQVHIMVVEDDASLAEWVSEYLISHGYMVTVANRGDEAIDMVQADKPDLLLLDIMLPVKDGFDICREVRGFYSNPILMLTACIEETDEVLGLELGADDYLAKPVKPRVLLARIKALLRRRTESELNKRRVFGKFNIDAKSQTVRIDEKVIAISAHEFSVLWYLVERAGQIVSREDLVSAIRGIEYDGLDRSVDICISRLRRKLDDDPELPRCIKTVRGKGYFFAVDAWS